VLGNPIKLVGRPDPGERLAPAPALGEHTEAVRREFAAG
jgi:crotonobetainyl-CoA:carnitine CoA-transferase CaiB-like acyl-CoA transferase